MKEESKKRSPFLIGVGIILLFIGGGIYTTSFFKSEVISQQKEKLATEIDLLTPFLVENNQLKVDEQRLDESIQANERLTLLDTEGQIIYDSSHQALAKGTREKRPEIKSILEHKEKIGASIRESDTVKSKFIYVAKPIYEKQQFLGILRLSEEYTGVSKSLERFKRQLVGVFLLLAFALLVMYYFLMKQSRKPIQFILPILRDAIKNPNKKQKVVDAPSEWQALYETVYELMDETNTLYYRQKQDENKLHFLFENLDIGIFIFSEGLEVTLVNQVAEKLFPKNKKGSSVLVWLKEPQLQEMIREVMTSKQLVQSELQVLSPKFHELKIIIRPLILDPEKKEYVGIIYDVTDIRQIERVHEDFIGNISHELKTPTTSIMGFAETLLSGAKDDPEVTTQFLEIIETESHRLMSLIQNIMMLLKTKKDVYMLDEVSVSPKTVIEKELERFRFKLEAKQIEVQFDSVFSEELELPGNAFQLIVKNLIENAIEYTEDQGKIFIYLVEQNNEFIFTVEDTGIGISVEDQYRIFERFYRVSESRQRNTGGSGLGLSIVLHYVTILGGSVKLTSERYEGTTVIVRLPFKRER